MTKRELLPFNVPPVLGTEMTNIEKALMARKLSGDGFFNKKCSNWLSDYLGAKYSTLVPSCTSALEMAYLLMDLGPGDEVILPSFTFTSTATAVTLFGATPVFVDVDKTMNLNLDIVEQAITSKTKAICAVHYAGTSCDMNRLVGIGKKHSVFIVEDAAQAIFSYYDNKPLGSFGDFAAFSFHETKNIVCGEGGALIVNNGEFVQRAEIVKDKGTNRQRFLRGEVDKYTWEDKGSSYLLGEIPAAFLWSQIEAGEAITQKRLQVWERYKQNLESVSEVHIMQVPPNCKLNAHIFYIVVKSESVRDQLAKFLRSENVLAISHYVPLHSSRAGKRFGRSHGEQRVTDDFASRLLRLPLYFDLSIDDVDYVCGKIRDYFSSKAK